MLYSALLAQCYMQIIQDEIKLLYYSFLDQRLNHAILFTHRWSLLGYICLLSALIAEGMT